MPFKPFGSKKASAGARPGSSVPRGRNYQGNRFEHLFAKAKKGKKGKKKGAPAKAAKAAKAAGVKPMGLPLAMAMRG